MRVLCRPALIAVVVGIGAASAAWAAQAAETLLPVSTSWIGNTFGFTHGDWTQINITAIAVAPDGKVYTNAPWDESGAEASVYQDGKPVAVAGGTHGWGNAGGNAVAINRHYAFFAVAVGNERGKLAGEGIWPKAGNQWFGITRRAIGNVKQPAPFKAMAMAAIDPHAQLATGFLAVNEVQAGTSAPIRGLAASETTLYASNPTRNEIDLFDAETMKPTAVWHLHEPGHLALARDGTLWVLIDTLGETPPKIEHYASDGQKLSDEVALPSDTVAADLAVDSKGRLLIADNGWRQQVLIFAQVKPQHYELADTLGERSGIFGGPPSMIGRPGPLRFNGLTGVGVDAAGNVYVSMNGIGPKLAATGVGLGASLQSYTPDARLRWQVDGLLFVDGACVDPGRPDSVFTGDKRFEFDWSKPSGHEWKYVGFLSNRFKYPQDTVFSVDKWPGTPMARRVNGRTFLYLTDMYADHLKIYRFDPAQEGETAIPSGYIAGRESATHAIPNRPPGGDWIWRNGNGDGRFDAREFERNTTNQKLAGGWGWWVDTNGDIWRTNDTTGVHRLRFGGVDRAGNPIYSYAAMTTYPMPEPFTFMKRAIYDAKTDTLYATGYTNDAPAIARGFPKEIGRVLVRYDHFTSDAPSKRYEIPLPWQPQANPRRTLVSVTAEGAYVFAVEFDGTVHVYDANDGSEVGIIRPGSEVGHASGYVDVANGISAHRRDNGEYLVFVEEDARGKVMMYRWNPRERSHG